MSVFIQIGTNDGNDNFRKLVLKHRPHQVVLIEPNAALYETIRRNYEGIPNITILSRAIYYEDDKQINLYIGEKFTSHQHFSLVPMNNWGDKSNMTKITANSIRFDTLCSMLNIHIIDYLQIDTEGFDSEIIDMIDFTNYTIHQIRFEKWNFAPEVFTKHNEDIANKLGKTGMTNTIDKLQTFGYTLVDISDEDGQDTIASRKTVDELRDFF